MREAVRLVIWDLDETFWRGTHTEGGIQEYVAAHHDAVVELARRGIMSSVCSKNSPEEILPILKTHGIADYFIFPSVSWEAKGSRLADIIKAAQLRPASVMFIDDNPSVRAEAAARVPELQVEDETFIARMLDDPRLRGKHDPELTRLKQYKLLESKQIDRRATQGNEEDFLRSSEIKVFLDFNIEKSIDRAVELIKRTNQLNYTKRALPDSDELARVELRKLLIPHHNQAGLIRVADRYGDYGYVGFFLTGNSRKTLKPNQSNRHLIHFCFSCRTLGMYIEQWVYERLGRPELDVVGDVLTDLSVYRSLDWIEEVSSLEADRVEVNEIAPRIVLWGGCEQNAVGVYLASKTKNIDVFGNYSSNGLFVISGSSRVALDSTNRTKGDFVGELTTLGLPPDRECLNVFDTAGESTLFLFNFTHDAACGSVIRHKEHGWNFWLETNIPAARDIVRNNAADFLVLLGTTERELGRHLLSVKAHIDAHYELLRGLQPPEILRNLREVAKRVPVGSKLIFGCPPERCRNPGGTVVPLPATTAYRALIEQVASENHFIAVAPFSDCIHSDDDFTDGDHLRREVYLRYAAMVEELARRLPAKALHPTEEDVAAERRASWHMGESIARDFVKACYRNYLRREPEPTADAYVKLISQGELTPTRYLEILAKSDEFKAKWSPLKA